MARVYLETSFISACVTDREDAASVYRRETSLEWWEKQGPRHELVVSTEVLAELDNPGFRGRDAALAMIEPLGLLAADADALGLAQVLVRERVMPGPIDRGDSMHVAIATVHGTDFIVSWNVRHLANLNKLDHLRAVTMRLGLLPPMIVTPDLLWESP
ncbi:MAG: hypothetical protein ACF8R7_01645 [Phycisphaerales bacterium JB039]